MKASKSAKNNLPPEQAFESYYENLFGGRWVRLKEALLAPPCPVGLRLADETSPYYLDKASIAAAASLPLQNADTVLDMCAAPGGKTLVLAALSEPTAHILANDRSDDRVNRLKKSLDECLPPDVRCRIHVSRKDAAAMCRTNVECFDRILLDAPCSSERHVLTSSTHLKQWSPNRIKSLAVAQWALLSAAFRMLKPAGYMLYATCALSDAENDSTVGRLLTKFDNARVINDVGYDNRILQHLSEQTLPVPEQTRYGCRILPDVCDGCGPLYYSLIYKTP